ncbi:MAG: molybdopterin molybdotransferase MoeA [Planctomycetes bacterium]|nr:molybdopterin molybdotransferase MoeA [Planctomycetota bacterium]
MIARIEAQRRVARLELPATRHERVRLDAAVGRVLATAPVSDLDLPPFDRVTMDGFAVRAAEVVVGTPQPVFGATAAGQLPPAAAPPRAALRIMTGAPLPAWADAVIPLEEAQFADGVVSFARAARAGQNIHPRASDLRAGAMPLPAGTRLTTAAIPLLATLGCAEVVVGAAPEVALVTTGSELVELDVRPTGAAIRDSNRHGLAAQVASAGARPRVRPIVRDEPAAIRRALEEALAADVVLLTGGSSVGDFDFAHDVLAALGAEVRFDAVAIKPGKPVILATLGRKVLFCLPGNPVSAFVTFELLVRPLLERWAGAAACWPVAQWMTVVDALVAPRERDLLQLARLDRDDSGELVARPIRWSGSGDLVAIASAGALIQVERGATLAAGARARVLQLRASADALPRAPEPCL